MPNGAGNRRKRMWEDEMLAEYLAAIV